ncbi:MAG: hypothetical protein Ct9H300mP27_09230 [Chloroflexota bacterium]|nr:MAG: hypothetical protein Ct9H300mP27_09230 [Chloroflexota bacterium]
MLTLLPFGRVFDYSYCIGMYSQSGQGFWAPQDFVLGRNGRIYVLSRGVEQLGQRISKLDFDQQFQGQFGSGLGVKMAGLSGRDRSSWTIPEEYLFRMNT